MSGERRPVITWARLGLTFALANDIVANVMLTSALGETIGSSQVMNTLHSTLPHALVCVVGAVAAVSRALRSRSPEAVLWAAVLGALVAGVIAMVAFVDLA